MFNLIYHKFGNWIHSKMTAYGCVCVCSVCVSARSRQEKNLSLLSLFIGQLANFSLASTQVLTSGAKYKNTKLIIINCVHVLSFHSVSFSFECSLLLAFRLSIHGKSRQALRAKKQTEYKDRSNNGTHAQHCKEILVQNIE